MLNRLDKLLLIASPKKSDDWNVSLPLGYNEWTHTLLIHFLFNSTFLITKIIYKLIFKYILKYDQQEHWGNFLYINDCPNLNPCITFNRKRYY